MTSEYIDTEHRFNTNKLMQPLDCMHWHRHMLRSSWKGRLGFGSQPD
jgi:hypothetical protein